MKRKYFTLLELIIVIIILSILATAAIPLYYKAVENAKSKACELNLKALLAATEAYAAEHDAFPGSLSALPQRYLERAFARIMEEEGQFKVRMTYFLVELDRVGSAFANEKSLTGGGTVPSVTTTTSWIKRYVAQQSVLHCPAKEGTGISYGINGFLTGKTLRQYDALSDGLAVVADCDNETFIQAAPGNSVGGLAARHKDYKISGEIRYYGHSIEKGKKVKKQQNNP